MRQDILILNLLSTDDRPMSSPSSVKFGPRTYENLREKMPHFLKFDGGSMLNH